MLYKEWENEKRTLHLLTQMNEVILELEDHEGEKMLISSTVLIGS